jgi:hypothetical protein
LIPLAAHCITTVQTQISLGSNSFRAERLRHLPRQFNVGRRERRDGHFNLSIRSFEHARSTLDLKSQLASKKSGEQLVALARGAVRGKPPENLDRRPVLVKV